MPRPQPEITTADRLRAAGGFFANLDYIQLFAMLGLLGIGLIFIYSTGSAYGIRGTFAFYRQLQWIGLGGILWLAASLINYRSADFRFLTIPIYISVVILLILTLKFGTRVYGATRWIAIGSIRIQPSEFAKLAMILLLSVVFAVPRFDVNRWKGILISLLIFIPPFFLVAKEPDLGSSVVMIPAYLGIVFCAGLKWRYILVSSLIVLLIGGAAVLNETMQIRPFLRAYQRDRIKVFLNPESDRLHRGYNAYQARLAVGSGGVFGKGIGKGEQNNLGFLPHTVANNDFIFSVVAEETGFAGALLLILLYGFLLYSIWRTAYYAAEPLGRYIAVGIGCVMIYHIFVNIGMCIGVAPVTGVPLPFVSYGGSFMLTIMAACGVLQSIYRHRRIEL